VDVPFYYKIPENTFSDVNQDPLKITVYQSNGKPIPKWMKWDPFTLSLSGKPGLWDTGTFQDNKVILDVWASDGTGSTKSKLVVIVQGESFWEIFLKVGLSIGSVATTGISLYRSRALIRNHFMKKKYQKEEVAITVGTSFSREILEYKEVKAIQVLHEGKLLSELPVGLEHNEDKITGTPERAGCYTIRIIDHNDYIDQEFKLTIKNS